MSPFTFDVYQQPRANRSPAKYLQALFGGRDQSKVRLLLTDETVLATAYPVSFHNLDLFIAINDGNGTATRLSAGPVGEASCSVDVEAGKAERIVEDIIIDIALGTFFRAHQSVGGLVAQQGLPSLFRRKAQFFRKNIGKSWISQVADDATYATLSSLNKIGDDDILGRAVASYETWLAFSRWLTAADIGTPRCARGVLPVDRAVLPDERLSLADLLENPQTRIPKVGGQLPLARIRRAVTKLPAGEYTLIVLTKSASARKSRKLRGKIASLFGQKSRRNSFRLIDDQKYFSSKDIVDHLIDSSHIIAIKLVI